MYYKYDYLLPYSFYTLLGAAVIILVGFFYIYLRVIRPTHKNHSLSPSQKRHELISIITFTFFMITIFILSFISFWVLGLKTGTHRVFPNDLFLAADDARVIYESRNILGYAETVAITSVGIFLPLLIILWNISRESVSGSLEKLIALRGATHSSRNGLGFEDRLEAAISLAYADLTYLRQTAKELSTVFWKIVWAIVLFFIGLSCANFLPGQPLTVYIVVVVLKGLSMVITLWLFGFLLMYVVVVQPIVRETRYEAVYELEKQYLK